MRVLPRGLGGRLIGAAGLVAVLGGGALLWGGDRQAWRDTVGAERTRVATVATLLAPRLSGDLETAAAADWPQIDAFETWERGPRFLGAPRAVLADAEQALALGTPLYTARLRPERLEAIRSAPDRPEADAMEFLLTSAEQPYWLHRFPYRPEMAGALFEGRTATTPLYTDAHGSWVSAYAPVRDASGTVVGVLEVDAHLDRLKSLVRSRSARAAGQLVSILVLAFAALLWVIRRLVRSLSLLEQAAVRLGRGDFSEGPRVRGGREVGRLARGLEYARRGVVEQVESINAARRVAERQLALAARGLDEESERRREVLEELAPGLRVTLEVAGHRVPVQLVDLRPDGALLEVGEDLPSLPMGAPARLRLLESGQPEARSIPVQVGARRGPMLEVLAAAHVLTQLPERLRSAANRRQALRIRPGAGERVAARIEDAAGRASYLARLIDLSPAGAGLFIDAEPGRIAALGRGCSLTIALPGRAQALRLTVDVRHVAGVSEGSRAGVCFVSGTERFGEVEGAIEAWTTQQQRGRVG